MYCVLNNCVTSFSCPMIVFMLPMLLEKRINVVVPYISLEKVSTFVYTIVEVIFIGNSKIIYKRR